MRKGALKHPNTIAMNSIFGHFVLFYNLRLPNRGHKTFNNVLTAAEKRSLSPRAIENFTAVPFSVFVSIVL